VDSPLASRASLGFESAAPGSDARASDAASAAFDVADADVSVFGPAWIDGSSTVGREGSVCGIFARESPGSGATDVLARDAPSSETVGAAADRVVVGSILDASAPDSIGPDPPAPSEPYRSVLELTAPASTGLASALPDSTGADSTPRPPAALAPTAESTPLTVPDSAAVDTDPSPTDLSCDCGADGDAASALCCESARTEADCAPADGLGEDSAPVSGWPPASLDRLSLDAPDLSTEPDCSAPLDTPDLSTGLDCPEPLDTDSWTLGSACALPAETLPVEGEVSPAGALARTPDPVCDVPAAASTPCCETPCSVLVSTPAGGVAPAVPDRPFTPLAESPPFSVPDS
jgi:hypothetical protein